jgi:hypothetical protein
MKVEMEHEMVGLNGKIFEVVEKNMVGLVIASSIVAG